MPAAVVNPTFLYDPQTQGAITSITASVDKNLSVMAPLLFSYGNSFRPVIEQDGNVYTASFINPAPTVTGTGEGTTASSGYNNFTLSNLTAADFNEYDLTTGAIGTAHPDVAGDAIAFGIGQVLAANAASIGVPATVTSDFDNLSISVQTAAVPEPAGSAMMMDGIGMPGASLRRRRVSVSYA